MPTLIFTIFGATGDLTFRKLIPALFTLFNKNLLPEKFHIIGFARREWSTDEFRNHLAENVNTAKFTDDERVSWDNFLHHLDYLSHEFSDAAGFTHLSEKIAEISNGDENVAKIFYMSTAPEFFLTIAENIKNSSLCEICNHTEHSKIIIEKPYGTDLANTIEIDKTLRHSFLPEHIYRIDHYLGKESIQNILVFRFANSLFERLWNGENIDHIQIKVDEKLGVENRGGFYDQTGAVKDFIQNHILQMIAITTMDAPASSSVADIQAKRMEILQNISLWDDDQKNIVLGQYDSYRVEKNVSPESNTETFAAMKLKINTRKWQNVPIYIRTGKKLQKKINEITIKFKDENKNVYDTMSGNSNNVITFRISPDEGISLMFIAKEPGQELKLTPVSLDFCYKPTFKSPILDSYVGLLSDVIMGDQSLFASIDEIISQWNFLQKISSYVQSSVRNAYADEGSGPDAANLLLTNDDREWIYNEKYTCAIR